MSDRIIGYICIRCGRNRPLAVVSPCACGDERQGWRVIRCDCGRKLEAPLGGDFHCEHCHREYNAFGQHLAPRELWGEETGETLADILGPAPRDA
jgi:DNA-directed RNA polymerase subunit RPC12/RpoP